jgi:RecG-like helicase
MTCKQSKCKYPVTCNYNDDCMEQLVIEANNRRKMNFKEAIEVIVELANKEIENNHNVYDVPNLVKGSSNINIEKAEQAFDIIEEELDNLAY